MTRFRITQRLAATALVAALAGIAAPSFAQPAPGAGPVAEQAQRPRAMTPEQRQQFMKERMGQRLEERVSAGARQAPHEPTVRRHQSAALLDTVQVDYYGSPVPITQVANVTLIDARTIGVQPWEKPMVAKVEKAIRDSDLGLNPATQGELIRVPMPALTEERRRDLIKVIKHEGENAKVAIRNLRRDAISHLKEALKKKEVAEDDERRAQDDIQKLTDRYVAEVDRALTDKEKDLMAI